MLITSLDCVMFHSTVIQTMMEPSSDLETELRGDSSHSHQRKQKVFHGTDNIVTAPWNGEL